MIPTVPFEDVLLVPLRNGLTKPKAVRGSGTKMVNMGELFAHSRIASSIPMDRVILSDAETKSSLLEPGDLLFARQSLVLSGAGKCSLILDSLEPLTFESHIIRARIDTTKADAGYVFYFFQSPQGQRAVAAIVEQTSAAGVRGSDLRRLRVPLPPVREQRRVSRDLRLLDDKIDVNQRIGERLDMIARALFRSWFVDFDPIRGRSTVSDYARRLFPDQLVSSPIGLVPEGWLVAPLGNHVEVTRGLSYTSAGLADDGIPLHNLNSIREGGGYKGDGIKYYVGEFRERDRVRPGDVIVANTEQGFEHLLIGYPALVPLAFGDGGIFSQDLSRLRPLVEASLTSRWLYLLLVGHRMHYEVVGYSNGTTVNHLAMDGLRKPLIAVPPRDLVEHFDAMVAPLFDQQEALVAESKTLAQLRDALLPKLISGSVQLAPGADATSEQVERATAAP